jgi:hypothetical protein
VDLVVWLSPKKRSEVMRAKESKTAKKKRSKVTQPDAYGTKTTVRKANGDIVRITYKPR